MKKLVRESLNFERGLNPKKSIGIGLEAPRRFKTIEEFTDFIIMALPLIFNGKMPEDILSKKERGVLPMSYYDKIAKWLTDIGHEMPNGNSNWKSKIEIVDKEFRFWTTPIARKLEEILGEKRWGN